jgi:hypothetical protein
MLFRTVQNEKLLIVFEDQGLIFSGDNDASIQTFRMDALSMGWSCGIREYKVSVALGRAIAQAVSRWLPTAAVRGSSPGQVMWDFVVDKVAPGQVSSEYFCFPCQIHSTNCSKKSSSINQSSGICTIGQMGKRLWPQYKGQIDT